MLLSDFLKNGTTLQGPAGVNAINANDLLLLNAAGKLYPVAVSDYAASANIATTLIASTAVSSFVLNNYSRKEIFASPIDGGLYLSFPVTTSNCGIGVAKYNSAGTLVKSLTIDSTASCSLQGSAVQQLSNGNILVSWCFQGGANAGTWFAIYDQLLTQVVAPTKIGTNAVYHDSLPLSGGGFAIAFQAAGGMQIGIYSNTGAVVSALANVTSSPTSGSAPRLAQLSNGNVAIAICSTVAGNALGHAIVTAAGAGVLNYTVLNAATIASTAWPEIAAAATGFYACAIADGTNTKGYVLNNAGAVQGAAFSVANTNVESSTNKYIRMLTDGSAFWLVNTGSGGNIVVYMPTTGTNYISNASAGMTNGDAFIDRGNLVLFPGGGSVTPYLMNSNGTISALTTSTGLSLTPYCIARPAGDFTILLCSGSQAGGMSFGLTKYQNAAIVGVSQGTVAAGNPGTTVPFSMGPGGYPCNAVGGTLGKAFDHTATNIVANKGTILNTSVSLKGI